MRILPLLTSLPRVDSSSSRSTLIAEEERIPPRLERFLGLGPERVLEREGTSSLCLGTLVSSRDCDLVGSVSLRFVSDTAVLNTAFDWLFILT